VYTHLLFIDCSEHPDYIGSGNWFEIKLPPQTPTDVFLFNIFLIILFI